MTGAVTLITDVLYGAIPTAIAGTATFLMFLLLWYLLPLRRRLILARRDF
jgi:hypothetical protein